MIGRVHNIRLAGKALFMDLQSGEQLYFSVNDTSDFDCAKNDVSRGDILELLRYEHFVTRTGHPSLRVQEFSIIKKCEANIPLVTSSDGEDHYAMGTDIVRRRRALSWVAEPKRLELIKERSKMIEGIRANLALAGSMEVSTPVLQPVYGGAAAEPFVTHHNALDRDFFLRISPELYLKRMVIAGMPFVHEFATCFRNEGIDRTHNPEFTLLEFYKAGEDYEWGMMMTEFLVKEAIGMDHLGRFPIISITEEVWNIVDEGFGDLTPQGIMEVFEESVEPYLADRYGRGVFVTGHPAALSPLALAHSHDKRFAERFELYIDGIEVANGYSEQNDWKAQQAAMQAMGNLDEDYIEDLKIGLPRTCGVGIGVDRLAMIRCGVNDIRDVIAFPAY